VLSALRRFGGDFWRYGYAVKDNTGRFVFEGQAGPYLLDLEQAEANCWAGSADTSCTCPWQEMVADEISCNFADCYVFSDILQHIVATAGIGGLIQCPECQVVGENALGFVTKSESRSLDPKFAGNIACSDEIMDCPSYYFGSHSLLKKETKYYDSTFEGIYSTPQEFIDMNVRAIKGNDVLFVEKPGVMVHEGVGYGDWPFQTYDPRLMRLVPPATKSSARFTEKVTFSKADPDNYGLSEALEALVGVEVDSGDRVLLRAALFNEDGTKLVANRPSWRTPRRVARFLVGPVDAPPRLLFSGEQIHLSKTDGPYLLRATLHNSAGDIQSLEKKTLAYSYMEFAEDKAKIVEVTPSYESDDEAAARLAIRTELHAMEPGVFTLQVRLSESGKTIANLGRRFQLTEGPRTIEVTVPAERIVTSGLKGPYLLTAELFRSDLKSIDSWEGEAPPVPPDGSGAGRSCDPPSQGQIPMSGSGSGGR
jgi:hypothetical protein